MAASDRLVGLSYREAQAAVRGSSCSLRIVELEGQAQPLDATLVPTRVNVVVSDGTIVRVAGLY